ncbi:1-deoxy-D-xylulose 5-phosphate reductoisomerase [Chitinispirillum alkaliphilum]|nr:1-deoxy-D-xylulose 5-phosphate reductoisomerase [Chitinispirillum alkaliphilum]
MIMDKKKILILGSTGSIGKSSCNCMRRFKENFSVTGLAAGNNLKLLSSQIEEFSPRGCYISDPQKSLQLRSKFNKSVKVYDSLEELVEESDYDILINALVGAAGFRSTIKALKKGKKVALANKESLVIGGDLIKKILNEGSGTLLPVDSEHSAILQCLNGENNREIEAITLTASGGPFRNLPSEAFSTITREDALNHPTWKMGNKITIDSSTLMNKGFEVIEAHYLFSLPYSKLKVCIHPQSIIHSMVEFHDGAVIAQLGLPDMELPIQYALTFPQRFPIGGKRLNLAQIGQLDFFEPDTDKFPCLKLCIEAGEAGGTALAVLNAANEVAVELFLREEIVFTEIPKIVAWALRNHTVVAASSIEIIEEADKETRQRIINEFRKGRKL